MTTATRRSPHSPRYNGYGGSGGGRGRTYSGGGRGDNGGGGGGRGCGAPMLGWTPRAPGASGRASGGANGSGNGVRGTTRSPGASADSGGPTWLQGHPGAATVGSGATGAGESVGNGPRSVEAWCAARLEAIRAAAQDGEMRAGVAVAELRGVMESLEYGKLELEREVARRAARERWRAHERIAKSQRELRRAERRLLDGARRAAYVETKLERLAGYTRFIENKWKDVPRPPPEGEDVEGAGADESSNGATGVAKT